MATTTAAPVGVRGEPWSSVKTPALVSAGLFVLSLLVGLVASGKVYASPFVDDAVSARFFADHPTAIQWVALCQFGSAIALVVATAAIGSRLRVLAPGFPSPTVLAVAGGIVASALLALNSLVQWALSHPSVTEDPATRRGLHYLFFGLGGFAHVAALGLLVGGVSLVSLRTGLLPRWFTIVSLVVAVLAVLSPLTMVGESLTALIPLGRFPTLVWLVVIGFLLPKPRTP
jgi:hypothetical protein